jgi:hypothetical protein
MESDFGPTRVVLGELGESAAAAAAAAAAERDSRWDEAEVVEGSKKVLLLVWQNKSCERRKIVGGVLSLCEMSGAGEDGGQQETGALFCQASPQTIHQELLVGVYNEPGKAVGSNYQYCREQPAALCFPKTCEA